MWVTPPILAERVSDKLKRRYRNLREVHVDRSRLGISEREAQANLRPKPRRILVMAGVLTKRPGAADTARGSTHGG